jgi:hypothetical protein
MAGKKRRKRRAHRARGATTTRSRARQRPAASGHAIRASLATASDNETAALSPREPAKVGQGSRVSLAVMPAFGWLGRMPMALLPGRVFFAMGRPVAGLACCVLQASVLGWLPAALWAAWAQGRVARKHRILAARLRSA